LKKNRYWLHALLFLATFFTTTVAGVTWARQDPFDLSNFMIGIEYSVLLLIFLSAHEFGHYVAARLHKVDATLPFYIPFPISEAFPLHFGTFGAVIKTRSPILRSKALFDIGVAGPIAGFAVSLGFMIYGLITIPPIAYPQSDWGLFFGDTIIYSILAGTFADPGNWLPPMNYIQTNPMLNVAWFGMFVTSLNMLPLGQLDGGHVLYAMFGRRQHLISRILWYFLLAMGLLGLFATLHDYFTHPVVIDQYPTVVSIMSPIYDFLYSIGPFMVKFWPGWLIWAMITKFFIKIKHPIIQYEEPLDKKRMAIGWFAILILILTFSYNGIYWIDRI
jgi:membrane-associated protease RseP (regulator of RpoE activity)